MACWRIPCHSKRARSLFGWRSAAHRRHVLQMIFGMGLRLLGGGIVIGMAAGVATNRLLVNQLWNT
jgi:hypothetical protein